MSMMFFHFLKIIFDIKTIQKVQTVLNFNKKKIKNLSKRSWQRRNKRSLKGQGAVTCEFLLRERYCGLK